MKYIKVAVLFVVAFSAVDGYSQTVVYRDLLGNWKNSKGAGVSYQFLDSANVIISSAKHGESNATYHLKQDRQYSILELEVTDEGIKKRSQYRIKKFDGTNLRLENIDTYDPIVQTKPIQTGLWLVREQL